MYIFAFCGIVNILYGAVMGLHLSLFKHKVRKIKNIFVKNANKITFLMKMKILR